MSMLTFTKLKATIIAVITILALIGCTKEDDLSNSNSGNKTFKIANDLHIYKEDVSQYIKEITKDGSSITFGHNTSDNIIPKTGDKIYIPISDKTPYGIMAQVKSVQKGESISVGIEPLPLDQAFEQLSIDESTPIVFDLEGVYDKNGNPTDFEIIDTTDIKQKNLASRRKQTREIQAFEFENNIKIPIKLAPDGHNKDKLKVEGVLYLGFKDFDIDIDIKNKKLRFLNLNTTPYVKFELSNTLSTERELKILNQRIAYFRFRVNILTPIPISLPVIIYIDFNAGIKGSLSAKLGLQYEYDCNCQIKYLNDKWNSNVKHGGFNNKSPWTVGEFDVNGEIYSGAKIGVQIGLYSAKLGIGFNVMPQISLATEAKLSSNDLLKTNPDVNLALKVNGEVYCVGELFGLKTKKYSLPLPTFIIWSQKTYLLPNITNFTIKEGDASAHISWQHDIFYFLALVGVKTGVAIFESDRVTEIRSFTPLPSDSNIETCLYNINATGLEADKTYYAAPFAYWKDYIWYGEMTEFQIEEDYEKKLIGTWTGSDGEDRYTFTLNEDHTGIMYMMSNGYTTEDTFTWSADKQSIVYSGKHFGFVEYELFNDDNYIRLPHGLILQKV